MEVLSTINIYKPQLIILVLHHFGYLGVATLQYWSDLGAPNPAQLSKAVALGVERHLGVSEALNSWGLLG